MSPLKPVSFAKGRETQPRLSQPYVPGRRAKRYWTLEEDAVISARYPDGGLAACQPYLPAHHASPSAIYQRANKLGLQKKGQKLPQPIIVPDDFDQQLTAAWTELDGRKKGEVAALANRLNVPRWYLTKAATRLGLTVAHKKEPRWTDAENDLMKKVPLHAPDVAARMFREHGFNRSPTAIMVRAVRLKISRNTHETLSGRGAAKILGIDVKGVTALCLSGELPASRREDLRRAQQGGSAWAIQPADLRSYVIDHLERIDLRKVDKFAFVDLLVNGAAAP